MQITSDNPLYEFQADRILLSTSAPHPPVASIVEPKYLNELVHGYRFFYNFSNHLFAFSLFRTSSFDFLSTHAIFPIHLHHHISNAHTLFPVSFLRVHVSHPL